MQDLSNNLSECFKLAEYPLKNGKILINHCDINQLNRPDLRKLIGIVPQHIELFSSNILENIVPEEENPDTERLIYIARMTGLMQFISRLPEGFHTKLGEHGLSLSGGERQSLALARALYKQPEMLILDEATSSVDTRTEILIQQAMDNLMRNRTSFIIAHRLSTIRNADWILVMDEGDIVEQGKHEELLERNGFYAELYYSQFEYAPAYA